jgi:hypothetical protein
MGFRFFMHKLNPILHRNILARDFLLSIFFFRVFFPLMLKFPIWRKTEIIYLLLIIHHNIREEKTTTN